MSVVTTTKVKCDCPTCKNEISENGTDMRGWIQLTTHVSGDAYVEGDGEFVAQISIIGKVDYTIPQRADFCSMDCFLKTISGDVNG